MTKHRAMRICDACRGTGSEEGGEWNSEPCYECGGLGMIPCDCDECEVLEAMEPDEEGKI